MRGREGLLIKGIQLNFRSERNKGKDSRSPYLAPGMAGCVAPN